MMNETRAKRWLLKAGAVGMMGGALLLGVFPAEEATGQSQGDLILSSELLGRPTTESITLQVLFQEQVEAYVEYGLGALTESTDVVTTTEGIFEEVLTGLSGADPP